jgi:Glu-tRNA(Gln) amidotransferase subunit E-like FAD-binding protein
MESIENKIDYEQLGFKSGLEIHQQLDTNKLFCNCPSVLRQDSPHFTIQRKLNAVAGESGEIDSAAKHEAQKEKTFIYECYDSTCLVELDEIPPYEINQDALKIALQISIMLNARILPISQIMRKTVIDGSNTSGFQRTVLIAHDGWIITKSGRVGIQSICLEEDAARTIERNEKTTTFRLDRLGIPLIEIATAPDIKDAEQVKEVALYLGNLLRSCKIKRGLGTIRQDVNISIRYGNRTEIKGFQDPSMMVETVNQEIKRQLSLIQTKQIVKSEVRNALPDGSTEFLRPISGSARMYPETDLPLLKISRDLINEVKKNLPELREDIEKELESKGLSQEMIKLLFKQEKIEEFKELLNLHNDAQLIAKILLMFPKEIASHQKKQIEEVEKLLNIETISFVINSLNNKKISQDQVKLVLEKIVNGEQVEKAIEFEKQDNSSLEEQILDLIKSKPGLSENAYMGLIMKENKGKVNAQDIIQSIRKFLNK